MAKKEAVSRARWTRNCPEEISRPKKPEWLHVPLKFLGPFAFRTSDEAIQHGTSREIHGQRVGVSEELARELVENLARRFNTDEHLEKNAPRFKDVDQRLDELIRLTRALAEHLESLDDITRHELQVGGTRPHFQHTLAELKIVADVSALPMPAGDEVLQDRQWTERLRSLCEYAQKTRDNAIYWRRFGGRDVKDTGGNTNLWKEEQGIPRWGLASDAIEIYDIFKPAEWTGTQGGSLHQFILAVYEYATGKEGEVHARMDDWVKDIVKPLRLDRELEVQEAQLTDEEIRLNAIKELTDSQEARLAEIYFERRRIHRERQRLWRETWPHVQFPRAAGE
jgi:hypothetical protein